MTERLQLGALIALRSSAEQQARFEHENGSRRGLRAADVVSAIDELLERRRHDAANDFFATRELPEERQALAKLIDACATTPTAQGCSALRGLRGSGWTLEALVDDRRLTLIATRPTEGP